MAACLWRQVTNVTVALGATPRLFNVNSVRKVAVSTTTLSEIIVKAIDTTTLTRRQPSTMAPLLMAAAVLALLISVAAAQPPEIVSDGSSLVLNAAGEKIDTKTLRQARAQPGLLCAHAWRRLRFYSSRGRGGHGGGLVSGVCVRARANGGSPRCPVCMIVAPKAQASSLRNLRVA